MSTALPVRSRSRLGAASWGASAAAVVLLASLLPLAFNPRFYFYADTQDGAYGIWYQIGEDLLGGTWPIFSLEGWMAGNHVAEGQWGLWNPLIMAIGVFVYLAPNAVVASSIVKIAFLMFAAVGSYLMARSYEASRPLAFVAGVAAPLAGFTFYMDAPSWVTNLFVWAFFPWMVWALRRVLLYGKSPLIALLLGYLLVTIGYVHGTILLVALYLVIMAEAAIARRWRQLLSILLVGVVHGLVALAVYLPGVLSASVSARATQIGNDAFMVATLTGLATSAVPSGRPDLLGWWGRFADTPLLYIAWFLPLLAFVDFGMLRRSRAHIFSLVALLIFSLVWVVGPSVAGPLQFPARIMPWLALTTIVLVAVLLTKAPAAPPSGRRLAFALSLVIAGFWLAYSQVPEWWRFHLLMTLGCAIGVFVAWLLLGGRAMMPSGLVKLGGRFAGPSALAVLIVVVSVGVTGLQARAFAPVLRSVVPNAELTAAYDDQLVGAKGEAFVAGSPGALGAEVLDETLVSNAWYLNPTPVQNLYTPVQYRAYSAELCMDHTGVACQDAARTLFRTDPETNLPLVDLLSIDTVQILRNSDQTIEDLEERRVPDGWQLSEVGEDSVLWERVAAATPPGRVEWASKGTRITMLSSTAQEARFRVDAVGAEGGSVAFSRLAWPGYSVAGGTLGERLRGYLLTVDLEPSSASTVVTVTFEPPAWKVVIGAMIAAALLTIGIAIVSTVRRRRFTGVRA